MNLNETNEPGLAATVPQILAHLILIGQRASLPDPESVAARGGIRIASIDLHSREDLLAWLLALGAKGEIASQPAATNPGATLYTDKEVIEHRGWSFQLSAIGSSSEATPLDADTVAVLEVIAEGPAPRVSDERVEYIIDTLNGFVVREYDGGTHIVNGAAVPCAQVAGCDANLDKAIAWAEDQPDVEATSGPLLGEANLRLVDGTFIEWLSDENQWAVTVSDDAEAVSA